MLEDYYPSTTSYYHGGIDDDLYTAKWGMVMTFLDLNDSSLTPFEGTHFALIGFKSDKGFISIMVVSERSKVQLPYEPSSPNSLGI